MRLRLAFKKTTSVFTFDGKRKKDSYWSRELGKHYPKKMDERVWIAKRKIEKYYAI